MKDKILNSKKEFRQNQFKIRKKLFLSKKKSFNKKLFEKLFKKLNIENISTISSFISINTEISTSKLNNYILENNKLLCFPVIYKKDNHLIFRKYTNDNDMVEGFMKIKEPSKNNEILVPDILFVPCLAFDLHGFRLGYGGGYYDRTFSHLKKNKINFKSIGYAFDGQKVSKVPKDKFDMKLDYVITEKQIYSFI